MIAAESPLMLTLSPPRRRAKKGRRKWYLGGPREISVNFTAPASPYQASQRMAPTRGAPGGGVSRSVASSSDVPVSMNGHSPPERHTFPPPDGKTGTPPNFSESRPS